MDVGTEQAAVAAAVPQQSEKDAAAVPHHLSENDAVAAAVPHHQTEQAAVEYGREFRVRD